MGSDTDSTPTLPPPSVRVARLFARAPMRHSTTQSTDVGLPRVTGDRYVPALLMSRETAFRQTIDERARFLLGFVDGTTPVFELLEASGMPLRDGVDALVILFEAGIIGLGEASQRISTPCAG